MIVVSAEAGCAWTDHRRRHSCQRAEPGIELADVVQQGTSDLIARPWPTERLEPSGDIDRMTTIGRTEAMPEQRFAGEEVCVRPGSVSVIRFTPRQGADQPSGEMAGTCHPRHRPRARGCADR